MLHTSLCIIIFKRIILLNIILVELGVSPVTPRPSSPPASFCESPEETDDFVLVPANLPFEEKAYVLNQNKKLVWYSHLLNKN